MAVHFNIESLSKSAAQFDLQQLNYWQRQAVAALSEEDFYRWVGEHELSLVPVSDRDRFITLIKPNISFPQDVGHWQKILFIEHIDYSAENKIILENPGATYFEKAMALLVEYEESDLKKMFSQLGTELNLKGKALYQPFRIALTDERSGPALDGIVDLMPIKILLAHLQQAKDICHADI